MYVLASVFMTFRAVLVLLLEKFELRHGLAVDDAGKKNKKKIAFRLSAQMYCVPSVELWFSLN